MSFSKKFVIVFLCAVIAFSPILVEARAGKSGGSRSGGSTGMGSRGSKTHDSNAGRPIERSMTPKPAPAPAQPPRQATPAPAPAPSPVPMAQPMAQPSFFQRHPILSGVMGGLAGSFIGNMLFNHSRGEAGTRGDNDWDSSASPTGHALGSMLPFLFIAGLILLGVWLYRRNAAQTAAANMSSANYDGPVPIRNDYDNWSSSSSATVAPTTYSLQIGQNDTSAFAELLINIQYAWGLGDLAKLQRLVTPEMLSYFSEILADNASQGVKNRIEQVKLLRQELKDAWEEENMQYATSLLTWSALDYTVKLDGKPGNPDYVTDGDMRNPAEASEVWTFARSRKGGNWLLSAIQQL